MNLTCSRRPGFRIEALPVVADQIAGGELLALFVAEPAVGHRHEPDVDVEPGLMTGMAERRRSAARLRQVADQDAVPSGGLRRLRRKFFEEADQRRVAPVAITRQPHHLPGLAIARQLDAALQAAARVVADRHRLPERGQVLLAEQVARGEHRLLLALFVRTCGRQRRGLGDGRRGWSGRTRLGRLLRRRSRRQGRQCWRWAGDVSAGTGALTAGASAGLVVCAWPKCPTSAKARSSAPAAHERQHHNRTNHANFLGLPARSVRLNAKLGLNAEAGVLQKLRSDISDFYG